MILGPLILFLPHIREDPPKSRTNYFYTEMLQKNSEKSSVVWVKSQNISWLDSTSSEFWWAKKKQKKNGVALLAHTVKSSQALCKNHNELRTPIPDDVVFSVLVYWSSGVFMSKFMIRCNTCQFFQFLLLANSRVEGSKDVDIVTCDCDVWLLHKNWTKGHFELVSFTAHIFSKLFFSRGQDPNDMSMYWHVMRQISAFDCREVFHVGTTLVFLGCFVAMTSSRSPWLYFQFFMTETILELVAMNFSSN